MDRRGCVLVVEDDDAMREMVISLLQDEGLTAVAARDGEDALRVLEGRHFGAILSDLRMPRKDGMELLAEVRVKWPAARVIMMTTFGSPEEAGRAIDAGAFDLIAKPFARRELLDVLARALSV